MSLKRPKLIIVGASTGGIEAISFITKDHPKNCPPLVISQHILPNFCQSFSDQLSKSAKCPTQVITSATELKTGNIYIQHPESTLSFKDKLGSIIATPTSIFGASIFRPCIDDTFTMAAKNLTSSTPCIIFLLTGMGTDGAKGLLDLKKVGQTTVVQDQASSVVYGMPRAAKALGANLFEMNLSTIRDNIKFLS